MSVHDIAAYLGRLVNHGLVLLLLFISGTVDWHTLIFILRNTLNLLLHPCQYLDTSKTDSPLGSPSPLQSRLEKHSSPFYPQREDGS